MSVLRLPGETGETSNKTFSFLFSLPCTVSTAVVFSSPHTQVYSPASLTSKSWITSCAVAPSCLMVYFSPGLSILCFFFHSTEAALDNSHCSVAVPPSVASSFFSSVLKRVGKAEEFKTSRMCDHGSYSSNNLSVVCQPQVTSKAFPNQVGLITTLRTIKWCLWKAGKHRIHKSELHYYTCFNGEVYGMKWRTTPASTSSDFARLSPILL